jgi:hypothetical protein
VIYYFRNVRTPLYLLSVFPKDEKIDLTPDEKRLFSWFVTSL